MTTATTKLGVGIGWRPELAMLIDRMPGLGFVEIIAEDFDPQKIPRAIDRLRDRGVKIIPHGVGLSLGSATAPDSRRLDRLAQLALRLDAPLVSEHAAFVRADGLETGHLLPLPRTRDMLQILCENTAQVVAALPVPLALENISALIEWPGPQFDDADFFTMLTEQSSAMLLLDVENIYANAINHGGDALATLLRMPFDKVAYAHMAGGVTRGGLYHDTHAAAIPAAVMDLLRAVCARHTLPGVMIERDGDFPSDEQMTAEFQAVADVMSQKGGDDER